MSVPLVRLRHVAVPIVYFVVLREEILFFSLSVPVVHPILERAGKAPDSGIAPDSSRCHRHHLPSEIAHDDVCADAPQAAARADEEIFRGFLECQSSASFTS